MIGKLNMIVLVVADIGRSVRFYRDVIGLRVEMEYPQWGQLDAGNIKIGLHPPGKELSVSPSSGCTFGFEVADIHTTVAALEGKGVRILLPPRNEEFGWLALLTDPDGYVVQLFQVAERAHSA